MFFFFSRNFEEIFQSPIYLVDFNNRKINAIIFHQRKKLEARPNGVLLRNLNFVDLHEIGHVTKGREREKSLPRACRPAEEETNERGQLWDVRAKRACTEKDERVPPPGRRF